MAALSRRNWVSRVRLMHAVLNLSLRRWLRNTPGKSSVLEYSMGAPPPIIISYHYITTIWKMVAFL